MATQRELAALSWLAAQPSVEAALDLAEAGKEEEAAKALATAVQHLLFGEESPEEGSKGSLDGESRLEPASKKARLDATGKAKATGKARCICMVATGMRGAGKSTLCSILREVLGGSLVNFDEINSNGSGSKSSAQRQAFATELKVALTRKLASTRKETADKGNKTSHRTSSTEGPTHPSPPAGPSPSPEAEEEGIRPAAGADEAASNLVYVDRTHTLRVQRAEMIKELKALRWRQRGCRTLLLEFSHNADTYGYGPNGQLSKRCGEQHLALCAERIEARGVAHHSLKPSQKLRGLLQKEARAAEAMGPDELRYFDARLVLDVSQSCSEAALAVIKEVKELGWLPGLSEENELLPRLEVAWQAYRRAEQQWRQGAGEDESPRKEWLSQCKRAVAAEKAAAQARKAVELAQACLEKARQPMPYWKFDLPEVSQVLSQKGILPTCFEPSRQTHVRLLQLAADGKSEAVAQAQKIPLESLEAMREALEALQGETFEARMTQIVISESIACAVVALPPVLPCASKVPHVVLGIRRGLTETPTAEPLLDQVKKGNLEGITCIELPTPRPMSGRVMLESPA